MIPPPVELRLQRASESPGVETQRLGGLSGNSGIFRETATDKRFGRPPAADSYRWPVEQRPSAFFNARHHLENALRKPVA